MIYDFIIYSGLSVIFYATQGSVRTDTLVCAGHCPVSGVCEWLGACVRLSRSSPDVSVVVNLVFVPVWAQLKYLDLILDENHLSSKILSLL